MTSTTTADEQLAELAHCIEDPRYFIEAYCQIYDTPSRAWIPFVLWPAQREVLRRLQSDKLVVILKARQLGLTWLLLAYALWTILYRPIATVLLFSRRDTESTYLLGDDRMRGMYKRLPEWLRHGYAATADSAHEWQLTGGSAARAFPTNAGDSYTATLAVVDEADLVPDLNRLMNAVKPTIDAGGQMVLLSRSDKSRPESEFKRIYRAAKEGRSQWVAVFLPWHAHPGRDAAWYEDHKREIMSRTTALDDLYQQYPATDTEALSPNTLDKRIPSAWIESCYEYMAPIVDLPEGAPAINGLEVFIPPDPKQKYVIGVDPAEGNPTSDASALTVLTADTLEEVAALAGLYAPEVIASHAAALSSWYNKASVLVERNNHGHAVLLWLKDNARGAPRLSGLDRKPGWLTTSLAKTQMYDETAKTFHEGGCRLHSFATYTQLASIEGATLSAPEGLHDDRATSYALAIRAATTPKGVHFA